MQIPPGTIFAGEALVFDMDGTLVDSSALITTLWRKWAERHGVDPVAVVRASAGRLASETVRMFAPAGVDAGAEVARLFADAAEATDGLVAVPGAVELVRSLPVQCWAIVTSAERSLAERWLRHTGLPLPDLLVTAEDVIRGKPDPEGYLLAARLLGCRPGEMIVFEDSAHGISAAAAAGARVIARGTIPRGAEPECQDWIVDFTGLSFERGEGTRD